MADVPEDREHTTPDQPSTGGHPRGPRGPVPPPADPWLGQAETQVHPVAGEHPPAEHTAAFPPPDRPDATRSVSAGDAGYWAGRAPVRPGGPPGVTPTEEWAPSEWPRRRNWRPAAIALAILIVLGLIVLGLWFLLPSQNNPGTPAPSGSPSASPTAASPTPAPTPTTQSPSPAAAMVTVPPLVGVPVTDAERLLDQEGLVFTVVSRSDPTIPADNVISTQPGAGNQVPVGSSVTLVVSTGPGTPPPSASPSPSTG